MIATPGNHEYYNKDAGPETDRRWTTKEGKVLRVTVDVKRQVAAAGKAAGYRVVARTTDGKTGVMVLDQDKQVVEIDAGITAMTGYQLADLTGSPVDKKPLRDRLGNPGTPAVSRHWNPQFAFPRQNAPAGVEETCYYLDYQGARIISLDSNTKRAEQVAWLREVLKNNPQRWTILTFHHPMFSPANNRDNPELRELWKPVLDEYKVDLVLTGHDHTYARSGDVSARTGTFNVPTGYTQAYDPAVGTVYVVSVSGPKMYQITHEVFVRTAEDTQLYQIIDVADDEIHYEARTATGKLYDAFVLKKRPGLPNELRELLPPESRRRPAEANGTK